MEKPTVVLACGSVQHELQEKRKSLRPGQMTKTLNNNANINYLSGLCARTNNPNNRQELLYLTWFHLETHNQSTNLISRSLGKITGIQPCYCGALASKTPEDDRFVTVLDARGLSHHHRFAFMGTTASGSLRLQWESSNISEILLCLGQASSSRPFDVMQVTDSTWWNNETRRCHKVDFQFPRNFYGYCFTKPA